MKTKLLIFFLGAFLAVSCEKDDDKPYSGDFSQDEILRLVNEARQSGYTCGGVKMPAVEPVTWSDKLAKAAYDHSEDMVAQDYFSHTSKDGRSPADRIRAVDYEFTTWGENIANGYPSEEAVIKGWLKSPGHCKNIMNASIKEMGVGRSNNYWTQVFAKPKE